ncbi:MAG: hypothetical protein HC893_16220 [Chloroflexaceae bacterium]|nr:hypothetical protein [Chloroflexaceae bacterium]NJL35110.1 hypothetical protein [Chloroflexaceae bacterium]NJO06780.1 hypothetical protein [Chloroflexaceae bacterium]
MIRSVTPGDLWRLRGKARNQVVFYDDTLLVQPHQPVWFAFRCFIAGNGRDRITTVYQERGVRAYVQAQGRSGRPEQDIIYASVLGGGSKTRRSDRDIWYRLLEHTVIEAGNHHVERLYAAIWNQQDEMREVFRQLGFQPYVRRYVLQLSGPDWDQGTRLAVMRTQSRRDSWAIHKLYGSVTPHVVQGHEMRTPRTWSLSVSQQWLQPRRQGWVLGADDDLEAYLHALSGPRAHVLTPLIVPAARESLPEILRFGLAQLHDDKPVYLLIAEYQSELLALAQNLGFQPIGEQTLLLKQTAVPARRLVLRPTFEPEPGLEPRVTVPSITVPREDTHAYVRTTAND